MCYSGDGIKRFYLSKSRGSICSASRNTCLKVGSLCRASCSGCFNHCHASFCVHAKSVSFCKAAASCRSVTNVSSRLRRLGIEIACTLSCSSSVSARVRSCVAVACDSFCFVSARVAGVCFDDALLWEIVFFVFFFVRHLCTCSSVPF